MLTAVRLAGPIQPRMRYAGYLVAQKMEFDRQAGLQIELLRISEAEAIDAVADGRADFGIATLAKVLSAQASGHDLILIFTIHQHSPNALLTRGFAAAPGLRQVIDQPLLVTPEVDRAEFEAMFVAEGVPTDQIRWKSVEQGSTESLAETLAEMDQFAVAADVTVVPLLLQRLGIETSVIRPRSHTISFPGDCVFCRADTATDRAKIDRMRTALQQGWRRTFTHPGLTIRHLGELQDESDRDEELLRFELERLSPLILPNLVEIGQMNTRRFQRVADRLLQLGHMEQPVDMSDAIYSTSVVSESVWNRWGSTILIVAGGGTLLLLLVLSWNAMLRRQVAMQTSQLQATNQTLEHQMDQLSESEARFRLLAESVPVSISIGRGKSRIFANRWLERLTGFSREELLEIEPEKLAHPDDRDTVQRMTTECIQTHEPARGEVRIVCKDGTERWIDLTFGQFTLEGQPTILAGSVDITERKQAEHDVYLRDQAIATSVIPVVFGDADHVVTYCNQAFLDLFRIPSAEHILGKPNTAIFQTSPTSIAEINETLARVGQWKGEVTCLRFDGAPIEVIGSGSMIYDEARQPTGCLVSFVDVTDRNQAERLRQRYHQGLEQLDELMRQLLLAAGDMDRFYNLVCNAVIQLTNAELSALPLVDESRETFTYVAAIGTNAQLLQDQTLSLADGGLCGWVTTHGESLCVPKLTDDPRVRSELAEALGVDSGLLSPLFHEGTVIGGLSAFRSDGPFDSVDSQLLNLFGEWVGVALENSRLLADLEQRVTERTTELVQANDDLEAYAHSVAHDLRAPLRAMYGFSKALREDYDGKLDANGREYTEFIQSAARQMDNLIQDLLEYSKIGQGGMSIDPVDLDDVVERSLNQVRADIERTNLQLTVDGPLGRVIGHRSTLVQMMSNLISNAMKFVEDDVTPAVRIRSHDQNGCVRLWVEDNGIGIDPEFQTRIFRVFERLHGVETYPGTGIGLAIVRRAIESMNGRFGVESTLGKGSQFWIELPSAPTT